MPSRCNPVPYCRIQCQTLLSCTVLPNAVKLCRTAESVLCYAGKLCRGNSYVPRLCETRLRQKRNKNEKSTHVRKSDPINSESHTRHSRNHPCPTPSSRKNIGPSPHRRSERVLHKLAPCPNVSANVLRGRHIAGIGGVRSRCLMRPPRWIW